MGDLSNSLPFVITQEKLERSFLDFARSALNWMQAQKESNSLDQGPYIEVTFDHNSYGIGFFSKYHRYSFNTDALGDRDEARACGELHWNNGIPAGVLRSLKGVIYITMHNFLMKEFVRPIIDSVNESHSFKPTDEQLISAYHRYLRLWSSPHDEISIVVPLSGIQSDIKDSLALGLQLTLSPLTPAEKTTLWNEDPVKDLFRSMPMTASEFNNSFHFQLSCTRREEKGKPTSGLNSFEFDEIRMVLLALRLMKPGVINAPALLERCLYRDVSTETNLRLEEFECNRKSPLYELQAADVPVLVNIVDDLVAVASRRKVNSKLRHFGELDIALTRFNVSYHKTQPEDRLIDLTIALESTLLALERDELKYRLSLRGAALLSNSCSNLTPLQCQTILRTMYDVRSGIVHNGQRLNDLGKLIGKLRSLELDPSRFTEYCEDIVRHVLRTYVLHAARGESLEQVNRALDTRILAGLIPKSQDS